MIILQILMALIGFVAICCAIAIQFPNIYNAMNENSQRREGRAWFYQYPMMFAGLSILGWGIIYYNAIYGVLWFIPADWGRVAEGEWVSMRSGLAASMAPFGVLVTLFHIQKYANFFINNHDAK